MGFINYRLNLGLEYITQISKLNLHVIFLMPLRTDVEDYAEDLWSFYVMGRVADEKAFDNYWGCKMDESALLTIRKTSNALSRTDRFGQ